MTAYRHFDCRDLAAEQRRGVGATAAGPVPAGGVRRIAGAVGAVKIPVRVAEGFTVNGRDVPVPMAAEDPAVVAEAGEMARVARAHGGFEAVSMPPLVQAQIQIVDVADPAAARVRLFQAAPELIDLANAQEPRLVATGGGAREIIVRLVRGSRQTYVVLHLLVDVRDAMGAGPAEAMTRAVVSRAAEVAGGRGIVHGVTGKADLRVTRVRAVFGAAALGGARVVDDMIDAAELAAADPYRAAGQNQEIMEGVTAVVLATGNDVRAAEAAAHAHAVAEDGRYTSLSRFEKNEDGDLVGTIEFPVPVGLADVTAAAHPVARANLARMGVRSASELAEAVLAVGLARNVAVLRDRAARNVEHDGGAGGGAGDAGCGTYGGSGGVGSGLDAEAREDGGLREEVAASGEAAGASEGRVREDGGRRSFRVACDASASAEASRDGIDGADAWERTTRLAHEKALRSWPPANFTQFRDTPVRR